ncbi:MAG: DUF6799 domain-containing protein [Ginsengibacter sp.]|jgi:hypothetical protein
MKNVFLTMIAVALSFGAFAQENTPVKDTVPTEQKTQKKDVYVMKDSKMWQIKAGEKSELTQDVTLVNGTIVMANGTVKATDGTTTALKNGQFVDLEGKIGEWKDDSGQ